MSDNPSDLIKSLLVDYFGLPEDWLIYQRVSVPGLKEYSITNTTYLQAISDLCEKFGFFLVELPDSTLQLIQDPWYARDVGGLIIQWEWTRDNSIVSEIKFEPNPNYTGAKVKVTDPGTGQTREFRNPEGVPHKGRIYDGGEFIAPFSNGPLLALAAYFKAHSTRAWKVEPVGLIDYMWGFQLHSINWEELEGTGVVTSIRVTEGSNDYSAQIGLEELKVA